MALRHEKRVLQRAEIALGREGTSQAVNFPEVRNEIVALKKLEQEQKEVAVRISQIEEAIKRIDAQRQQNAIELNEALAKLEEEKKPVTERRAQARSASDICNRELAGVERLLQDNDATDQQLLEKLATLQAQVPPPDDLEAQTSAITTRRAQLPSQRAEIEQARLGSADACRSARETLAAIDAELEAIDRRIAAVRTEAEARDRALNENSRAQQESLKEARALHHSVEERKNPAYLNIGRHLATKGIAPPNAPHLLEDVQRHRAAVERHSQHKAELAILSSQIDQQELRKFYFSALSVVLLLPVTLFLVFKSPAKREWLPQETEAILSVNTQQLQSNDLPKRWQREHAEEWQAIWASLTADAQRTPALNLFRDAERVTRALTSGDTGIREFVLVQARNDVTPIVRSVQQDQAFERRPISGLPVWLRPDFAVARLGPRTIAIGAPKEVEELVRVRLGIEQDLKITGTLFDSFQALDQETAVRLISSDPPSLSRYFNPIFTSELLESAQILGLGLSLQNPVRGRLLLKIKSDKQAAEVAAMLQGDPQRWLRIQDSDLILFTQTPEVTTQGSDIEVRFVVPENSARLLLQRVARSRSAPAAVANLE